MSSAGKSLGNGLRERIVKLLERKYRPLYLPLDSPRFATVSLSDVALMRKHAQRIGSISAAVADEYAQEDVRAEARDLAEALAGIFVASRQMDVWDRTGVNEFATAVYMRVGMGLAFARADARAESPPGRTEQCVWTALTWAQFQGMEHPQAWGLALTFSLFSGHFLGRTGGSSWHDLTDEAERAMVTE